MRQIIRRCTSIAVPALVMGLGAATPSAADVSPADVWAQWSGYLKSFGYTIENQPVIEGPNLRFPSFEMTMYIPSDPGKGVKGGTVDVALGEVALIDMGDGTVSIEMGSVLPVTIKGDGPGDQDFTAGLTMTLEGHRTIASGVPGDITYAFTIARMGATLDEIETQKGQMPVPGRIALMAEGASGRNRITGTGTSSQIAQAMNIAKVTYDIAITDPNPGKDGSLEWQGEITNLVTNSTGIVPPEVNPLAIDEALANGYEVSTQVTFGGGQGTFSFAEGRDQTRIGTSSKGGEFTVHMSAAGLDYNVLSRDLTLSVASSQIPFPIETTAAAIGTGFTLPVIAGEAEQDFGVSLTVTDLAIPEQLWMMADPGNGLPHDPVTLEIDLSGKTRLFIDIMNEAEMRKLDQTGGVPGEITALSLEKLRIGGLGALVEADAQFDVDNDSPSMFNPDMPAFGGVAALRLVGVTTLLNKLGQMGLIPMQQALVGAGMIQQLGKPGAGADEYTADIALSPDGALSVNGTPIPLQ